MSKEVTVSTWCDRCALDNRREPGETTPPLIIGGRSAPKTLDLCERHRQELVDPLVELLARAGAAVQAKLPGRPSGSVQVIEPGVKGGRGAMLQGGTGNSTPGPFDCKVEGCSGRHTFANGGRGYPNLGAFKSHLSYAHQLGYPAYVSKYGEAVPEQAPPGVESGPVQLPPGVRPMPDLDLTPEQEAAFTCGVDGCTRTFLDATQPAQALGYHRRTVHQVIGKTRLVKAERKAERQAEREELAG